MSRYDIEKFDPPPDPDLVCCICQCVLDKAVECPCRHVFCQSCIERWLTNRHTCPTCRKRTRKQDLKPVLPLVQNMLNRLLMICDFRNNGCVEKIMLEHFDRHVKNCGYEMKTCKFSKCGAKILRMHLEDHENKQCEHRESACGGECGLMIPLSDRPTHDCVAALKGHIDEKNKMIEQLKVKLHELNNLSQSLNDQLVELRQQLSNQIFSSDSSDSSDSDVTDFMSDDLSRDSFRDSWFDSAASNISADNVAETISNNNAGQENNNSAAAEGSDVVEQVERTVVNSLFELSSRLERVRHQMRAVLNSRLVQDQNTLNDDVRIPSAAELDAIVNSNNNDGNNNTENVGQTSNSSYNESYDNNDNDHGVSYNDSVNDVGDESQGNRTVDSTDNENRYFTEDEDHSLDRYSDIADSHASNVTNGNHEENSGSSDVSDLNWISDSDSNHTPYNSSPTPASPASENYRADAYESFRTENFSDNNQTVSDHIILSQPPDSPSDTTGSFSSIPSTSSVANSPSREDDHEDSFHGSVFTSSPTSNNHSSPARSDRSFDISDMNFSSPKGSSHYSTPRSQRSDESVAHSASIASSSPTRSFTSESSTNDRNISKLETTHYSSNENTISSFVSSANNSEDEENPRNLSANSSPSGQSSAVSDTVQSEKYKVQNKDGNDGANANEFFDETNCVDSSLDYGDSIEGSNDVDHLSEINSDVVDDYMMQADSESTDDSQNDNNTVADVDSYVSKCEPDSTFSPSALHQSRQFECTNGSGSNSTLSNSEDSGDSDTVRYLTKHVKRAERSREKNINGQTGMAEGNPEHDLDDPASTVDSGFITGTGSPTDHSDEAIQISGDKKYTGRKRKIACGTFMSDICKKSKISGVYRSSNNHTSESHVLGDTCIDTETDLSNSTGRYELRNKTTHDDYSGGDYYDCKKNKNTTQNSDGLTNSTRSRTSPSRDKQSWRDVPQRFRRNRSSANRRSSQTIVNNESNGQSLNVKIDLSLINYSGRIRNETASTGIPTTTVVHSANISPIPTVSTIKKESGHTGLRQHLADKSTAPKQDDIQHKNNHRQRSSRLQRQEVHGTTRNTHSSPARGSTNSSSANNRDFPNSWRDTSDSSSDNTWEPGSDCDEMDDTITEGEDGFETDSSYEVQIPKSTAALLDEYASDETDESWTVGMN